MAQVKIAIGSVVRLKSGGPKMTVGSIGNTTSTCVWMVNNFVQCGEFHPDCLVTATK